MRISEAVAEKIAGSGPTVFDHVVSIMAEAEIRRRTDIVISAIGRIENLEKEFSKINRPDVKTYDAQGVATESFSEKRHGEISKTSKSIKAIKDGLNEALEKNDAASYEKLQKAVGGKQDGATAEG